VLVAASAFKRRHSWGRAAAECPLTWCKRLQGAALHVVGCCAEGVEDDAELGEAGAAEEDVDAGREEERKQLPRRGHAARLALVLGTCCC
jgi:hypothetical protein